MVAAPKLRTTGCGPIRFYLTKIGQAEEALASPAEHILLFVSFAPPHGPRHELCLGEPFHSPNEGRVARLTTIQSTEDHRDQSMTKEPPLDEFKVFMVTRKSR